MVNKGAKTIQWRKNNKWCRDKIKKKGYLHVKE